MSLSLSLKDCDLYFDLYSEFGSCISSFTLMLINFQIIFIETSNLTHVHQCDTHICIRGIKLLQTMFSIWSQDMYFLIDM